MCRFGSQQQNFLSHLFPHQGICGLALSASLPLGGFVMPPLATTPSFPDSPSIFSTLLQWVSARAQVFSLSYIFPYFSRNVTVLFCIAGDISCPLWAVDSAGDTAVYYRPASRSCTVEAEECSAAVFLLYRVYRGEASSVCL